MEKPTINVPYVMYIAIYLLFALLFILWVAIVIRRRFFRRGNRRFGSGAGPSTILVFQTGPNQELPRGLEVSVIESFPKFAYPSQGIGADTGTGTGTDTDTDMDMKMNMKMAGECVVCLAAFEENATLRLVPKCGHVFHAECVDPWLKSNATCPFCRANLLPEDPPLGDTPTPVRVQVLVDVNGVRG